jgi:drug/metabolite transporter (DMT)-like permease
VDASFLGSSLLAAVSGVSFSLMGVAYKIGQPRRLEATDIAGVAMTLAAVAFTLLALLAGSGWPPPRVWALGFLAGVTQYATLRLVQAALRLGPLPALWCAVSLSFVPAVPYAAKVFGERPGPFQIVAVLVATACVLAASRCAGDAGPAEPGAVSVQRRRLTYLLVLVAIVALNGISGICITDMSLRAARERATYRDLFGDAYNAIFYASLAVPILLDLAWRKRLRLTPPLLGLGLLHGSGSGMGIVTVALASQLGGSIAWAICGACGILTTALVGALAFGERRTRAWYATCALGILAVALAQIKP